MRTKELQYKLVKLPYELVNLILEYDGRIKYKKVSGYDYHKHINIIHKYDPRYAIITPIIVKKKRIFQYGMTIIKNINKSEGFHIEFVFDAEALLSISYNYNYDYSYELEICFVNMIQNGHILGSKQTRYIYL